ncbi:MAG: hypothetical protein IKK59_05675 [Lachnospiraceae bacterium]|nr:hypothetical protein [Lachnospiraceae bacterium]
MAKQDKEFYWRMQGMIYALKIVKTGGKEALEKEIRMRNVLTAPLGCSEKQVRELYHIMSQNVYVNMLTAMMWTVHESFGFGKKRLEQLREDYNRNVEIITDLDYMGQHYIRLQDYAVELNQKYDLGLDIERIAACETQFDEKDERTRMCQIDRVLEMLRSGGYEAAAEFLEKKLD